VEKFRVLIFASKALLPENSNCIQQPLATLAYRLQVYQRAGTAFKAVMWRGRVE